MFLAKEVLVFACVVGRVICCFGRDKRVRKVDVVHSSGFRFEGGDEWGSKRDSRPLP